MYQIYLQLVADHKIEEELLVYLGEFHDNLFQIRLDQQDHMHRLKYLFHSNQETILIQHRDVHRG